VETPAIVAARIRRALPYVDANRIVVAPDCGLKYMPRDIAFAKIAMVEGALVVGGERAAYQQLQTRRPEPLPH
jgi:5-methyltetrahydropteroyltriglutamate--homocysteine methyltransferase